jgi:hypothetical protein
MTEEKDNYLAHQTRQPGCSNHRFPTSQRTKSVQDGHLHGIPTIRHRGQRPENTAPQGSASVELAILFPLALLLLLATVQTGLWWHTHTLCRHAAGLGVQAARTTNGTAADAHAAAQGFLTGTGNAASTPQVDVHAGTQDVSVTVSATVPRLIPLPGLDFRASYTAHGPKERWTSTPGGGGVP